MSIYIGNNKYKEIYLGSNKISEVYLGSSKIFAEAAPGPIPIVPIPGTVTIPMFELTYNTVQIGNRIWTCQNLEFRNTAVAKYAGFASLYTRVSLVKTFGNWTQACSYSGTSNYSWGWMPTSLSQFANTLTDGWRVPTETDWLDLFSKTDQEGLRNTRSDNWNVGAGTNYWYFNTDGYCGGYGANFSRGSIYHPSDDTFSNGNMKVKAYWTSTQDDSNYRIAYITTDSNFNNGTLLGVYNWPKSYNGKAPFLSIRLVKDVT